MKQSIVIWFGYLFSFLIISCAGTEFTHKQVNEVYKGKPFTNILVIAITGNEISRRSYEQIFVEQLKSVGVGAVSSEGTIPMPADLELKKEAILNTIHQFKNDAVIITRLIDKETKEAHTRGSYARRPGYSSTSTTLQLETNLYDVKTAGLLWSGLSKTWGKDLKNQIINDVIKVVINDLQDNKLISPK